MFRIYLCRELAYNMFTVFFILHRLQHQRSNRPNDGQKLTHVVNMVELLLKQKAIPIPAFEIHSKSYQDQKHMDMTMRKFSMDSSTYPYSMDAGDDYSQYCSESDEELTKSMGKNHSDAGSMFSASSSRMVSETYSLI